MATSKQVVRKNGIPVKRFWRDKINTKGREKYVTTYPIYFLGYASDKVGSLTDEKAPRTLEDAERTAKRMVEAPETEWTYATIYEMRAVVRYGTEFDWGTYEKERQKNLNSMEEGV